MSDDPKSSPSPTNSEGSAECGSGSSGQPIVHSLQQRSEDRPSTKKNKNAGGHGHLQREDGVTFALDSQNKMAVEIPAKGWTDDRTVTAEGVSPTLLAKSHDKSHLTGHTHAIPILVPSEPNASGTATATNTPSKLTTETSESSGSQQTLDQSTHDPYETLRSYSRDFLARPIPLRENGEVLTTLEAPYSLRLLGLLKSNDLAFSSLRTSKDSSPTTRAARSRSSLPRWMSWGTTLNGNSLTAAITESRRTGSGSSLSDILEPNPPRKYFLSDKAVAVLLEHQRRHKEKGHGWGLSVVSITKAEPET